MRGRGGPIVISAALVTLLAAGAGSPTPAPRVQFVFTSDAHYGIRRPAFRGRADVPAGVVNHALVEAINALPAEKFPPDQGVAAAEPVGAIDFVAEGGDVANREEGTGADAVQPASASWEEFRADYLEGVRTRDAAGRPTPVFVVPGNHDVSNAVGFYTPMTPRTDGSALVAMFNLMMRPAVPLTTTTFDVRRDVVLCARQVGGVRFEFVQLWPDSRARRWLDDDLARVDPGTPVILITHDQPGAQAKHFTNPNPLHDVNDRDRFENLLVDPLADGATIDAPTTIEQGQLEAFLGRHRNLVAYFHGNSNWNEFYEWKGPAKRVTIHTFRVDSPMKGAQSGRDESKLSFQVVTIDPVARQLTAREYLWNSRTSNHGAWGTSRTIALTARIDRAGS
jgi:hypothetical protein